MSKFGAYIITKSWRQDKPPLGSQINWSHPLSQGLVGCWLMNEGKGTVNCLVKKRIVSTLGTWVMKEKGYATKVSLLTNASTTDLAFTGAFSVVTLCRINQWGASQYPCAFSKSLYSSESSSNGYEIGARNPSSENRFSFTTFKNDAYPNYCLLSTTVPTIGNWFLVGTTDGATQKIYVNGKFENSKSRSGILASTAVTSIGGKSTSLVYDGDVSTYLALAYNRALSPSEIQSLYVAPYQFIQPIRRRVAYFISGGTSAPITLAPHQFIMVA